MSLTLGAGPLAGTPVGELNFSLDARAQAPALFEDHPRRIRALVDGRDRARLHARQAAARVEHPAALLRAAGRLRRDVLEATDHTRTARSRATPRYCRLKVGERRIENAVWHYPEPLAEARLASRATPRCTPRRPTCGCRRTSRCGGTCATPTTGSTCWRARAGPTVQVNGERVAESDRPKLLFETSVPPRVYLLRADVLPGVLEPSDTTTACPYKGDATYWHVRTPDGLVEDGAWSYETPLPEALRVTSHLSFQGEGIEVELE